MKPSLPLFHGLAATTALGLVFTASTASAATILTFEGQANNSTIANTFGDFAAANSAGVVTAVVVTVCVVFQLALVKVSVVGANVHWSGVAGSAPMVTVAFVAGCAVKTTVNAPVAPPSVAVAVVVVTVKAPTSLSVIVNVGDVPVAV